MKAIDVAREISRRRQGQHARLLRRRHAARLRAGGDQRRAAKRTAASMTLLTTMLDFSDTGEIGLLVDETIVATREAGDRHGRRCCTGKELALRLLVAARQRPDLAVRRQQLPQGQGAAGVRPALLELRRRPTCRARCTAGTCAIPTSRTICASPAARVQCGVPVDLARIDVPAFVYASREDHIVPWQTAYASDAAAGRRDDVRARRERPHRGRDQPARQEQAQLLGRRRSQGRCRRTGSTGAQQRPRQLVARTGATGCAATPARRSPRRRHRAAPSSRIEPRPGRYVKAKAA